MNDNLNKNESRFTRFKKVCKEQLWLVFLLAPLLMVGMLVGEHYQASKKVNIKTKSNVVSATVAAAVELSSSELATIVAKPLAELLVMEVYFDTVKKGRSSTRVSSVDGVENVGNEAYSQVRNMVAASYANLERDRQVVNKVKVKESS